ncbi:unnamed protein product [Rotaria socialis]|nr:unnamed protein product [Rotaria socialis]CAF3419663.1 unnamed protein product [Rotaria socialis]CAF3594277.1 unnamed protein product [Rotaria socialis]CAF4140998.1 unnamed protein product [Rotaria socialis]CAF4237458.1 unnamed protein product [Rotaria socialis]
MLFIKVSDGIKCIDDIQMQFYSSEVNLTKVMKTLNNLKSSDKKKCQVYIELNSVTKDLVIQFDQSMQLPRLRSFENVHVQISTSITSANPEKTTSQTSINTTVYITCQSNDECDTQFIEEYLTWLIKKNYRNLESSIRPLILVQGEKKNECTIGNGDNVKPCYNNSCSWYYSVDTTLGEGKCENTDLHEQDEMKPARAIFKHRLSIKFWCELSNCNNEKVGKLVEETVSKQYDLWTICKTC